MATERHGGTMGAVTLHPEFILPDPPRIIDMMRGHLTSPMFQILEIHFGRRKDVLVAGAGYLRLDPMDESERFAPNLVVAFGVDPKAIISRNGYIISEVGKPPDFVLEMATRFTATPDFAVKREGYRRYGVKEYWRFDETGGSRNGAPLIGDALAKDGAYVPIPIVRDEHFRHWGYSDELSLFIGWDDGRPRFYDPLANKFPPDMIEASYQQDLVEIMRDIDALERGMARGEIENLDEAESELARLREKSNPMLIERLRFATKIGSER